MWTILHPTAILDAAHSIYASSYMSAQEEQGVPIAHTEYDVPRISDNDAMVIMAFQIGMIRHAWKYDPGLVFYHMGIGPDDVNGQAIALYRLIMGCMGHGVSLRDDHAELLEKASLILLHDGSEFDPTPCDLWNDDWDAIASDAVAAVAKGKDRNDG